MLFRRPDWLRSITPNRSTGRGKPGARRRPKPQAHAAASLDHVLRSQTEALEDRTLLDGKLSVGLMAPSSAAPGSTFNVTVTLTNTDIAPQTFGAVDLQMLTSTVSSISSPGGSCFESGPMTICFQDVGNLSPGQSASRTFGVTLSNTLTNGSTVGLIASGSTDECFLDKPVASSSLTVGSSLPQIPFAASDFFQFEEDTTNRLDVLLNDTAPGPAGSNVINVTMLPGRSPKSLQVPFGLQVPSGGGSTISDGDVFTLTDGEQTVMFEFDRNGSTANTPVPVMPGASQDEIASQIIDAIRGPFRGNATPSPLDAGSGIVNLDTVFEFDPLSSGLSSTTNGLVVPPNGGGGIGDGETFTLNDGNRIVTFEFDSTGGLSSPLNRPVPFSSGDSQDAVASAIADEILKSINGAVPTLNPLNQGGGVLNSGDFWIDPGTSSLTYTLPVKDGDKFTIDSASTSVTFEFDVTGLGNGVSGMNVPINITSSDSVDQVVDEIVTLIGDAALGLSPSNSGNGQLDLNPGTGVSPQIGRSRLGLTWCTDLGGSVSQINDALTYTPPGDFAGTETFTYTIESTPDAGDGEHTGTVTIEVLPINDGPINSIPPGGQSTDEDNPLSFTGPKTISITDIDSDSGSTLTVTLDIGLGTASVPTGGGTSITNNGSGNVTLNGTVSQINNTLGGLTYTPGSNFSGSDTLQITTNDNGNTGGASGDPNASNPLSDVDTVNITINPVNDAPTLVVPGSQSFFTDFDNRFSSSDGNAFQIDDVDAGSDDVQVDLTIGDGSLTISSASDVTVTSNGGNQLGLRGTVTDINAALSTGFTYRPPSSGPRTLTATVNDLGHNGGGNPLTATDTVSLTITPPQVPFAASDFFMIDEDGGTIDLDLLVNDDRLSPSQTLTITEVDGMTVTGSPMSTSSGGLLTFNSSTGTFTYKPATDFFGLDTFTYTIEQSPISGDGPSTGTVNIEIHPINDGPINSVPGPLDVEEDDTLSFSSAGPLTITDVDAGTSGVTVTLTVGNGTLNVSSGSGATITDNNSGNVTIDGTISQINGTLGGLTYTPTGDFNGLDTLSIRTNDNGGTGGVPGDPSGTNPLSDLDTVDITVQPINDGPVIVVPGSQTFLTDFDNVLSAANGNAFQVSDIDAGSDEINLDLTDPAGGVFNIPMSTGVTVTENGSSSVLLQGTVDDLNALLSAGLTYRPDSESNRTLTATVSDLGHNGGAPGSPSSSNPLTDSDTIDIEVLDFVPIEIPLPASGGDFTGSIEGDHFTVTGPGGEIGRALVHPRVLISVTGSALADSLNVDLSGLPGILPDVPVSHDEFGFPLPPLNLTFDGDLGFDSLSLGGRFGNVFVDHTSPSSGLIDIEILPDVPLSSSNSQSLNSFDIPSSIFFDGLEPLDLTGSTIDELIISLPDGVDNDASLVPVTGGLELLSNSATFERTAFAIPGPGQDVVVNLGDGDDIFDGTAVSTGVTVSGEDGNDVILGGRGRDVFSGGDGDDYIQGGAGFDRLFGGSGNDTVRGQGSGNFVDGGPGIDRLEGGAGPALLSDEIDGNANITSFGIGGAGGSASGRFVAATVIGDDGDDGFFADSFNGPLVLIGNAGNDILRAGRGNDFVDGGPGDDYLQGARGDDELRGGPGDDIVRGLGGQDLVDGGEGVDFIDGGEGNNRLEDTIDGIVEFTGSGYMSAAGEARGRFISAVIHGGAGPDTIIAAAFPGPVALFGNGGDDNLLGGREDDHIEGGDGDDFLRGAGGGDFIDGGAGNDVIRGQGGNDELGGGTGDDQINGGAGATILNETADTDLTLTSGPDSSVMLTGLGNDTIVGRFVAVVLTGGDGNNTIDASGASIRTVLSGLGGDDLLIGGSRGDLIRGGDGDDLIRGGRGNDRIFGDHGEDVLLGQDGNDALFGGAGSDTALGGTGDDFVTGNGRLDVLAGGDGVNVVIGTPNEIDEAMGPMLEAMFS